MNVKLQQKEIAEWIYKVSGQHQLIVSLKGVKGDRLFSINEYNHHLAATPDLFVDHEIIFDTRKETVA